MCGFPAMPGVKASLPSAPLHPESTGLGQSWQACADQTCRSLLHPGVMPNQPVRSQDRKPGTMHTFKCTHVLNSIPDTKTGGIAHLLPTHLRLLLFIQAHLGRCMHTTGKLLWVLQFDRTT